MMCAEPRRLRAHKSTATCCIASTARPGVVATSGEDGCVCWFDLRCKDVLFVMDVGSNNPISSLCFKPGNEDVIYISSGNEVKAFDVNMGGSWKPLESYNFNKEEINQISFNSKASFLAVADDSGDVKIFDTRQQCLYKTLRAGHTSICSSVKFLPWRHWDVISGGLDSKLLIWDFSKGRPHTVMDFDGEHNGGECFNPAFVHALAVPEVEMVDKLGKICAVARGDGVVNVFNIESDIAAGKSKVSKKPKKGALSTSKGKNRPVESSTDDQNRRNKLHLDYSLGGHTSSVSCVAFSMFGERGKFIISGGNDKSVKVWDWQRFCDSGLFSSNNYLHLNINLSRKVNWLCTTPTDAENLVVCDTSKVVKVYNVL